MSSVPNALTFTGLFFGCEAVFTALDRHLLAAAYLVSLASIIDSFDGAAARLLHAYSPFGSQLDSLADTVAVGVAPAVLLYEAYFRPWHALGVLVATSWVIGVVTRLARFNSTPQDKTYFAGLPSPPAANILCGTVLVSQVAWHRLVDPWVIVVMMVALLVLMVSKVQVEKGSFFSPEQLVRSWRGRLAMLACAFAAVVPWAAPFVVFAVLVLLVLIRGARRRFVHRALAR